MRRAIIITLAAWLALVAAGPALANDGHFQAAAKRFFAGAVDWRLFKAQAMAESGLNPAAVSPVGARGLMQLMPGTSREVAARLGLPDRPHDPRVAIILGVAYDRQLWGLWASPRPERERLRLTLASYNAGAGNILKAQRKAMAAGLAGRDWADLVAHLPAVTGHHSRETINYVARIEKFHAALTCRAAR